ncbi:MAG TPA: ABC transporter ATP-binding protein [Mycobacteriales bacterium]|jgi:putative ABC transport system ATP-binding protein|nr:ABC transporter ATP-binding protein [Mycobacteriales bacterium]
MTVLSTRRSAQAPLPVPGPPGTAARAVGVTRSYGRGDAAVCALQDVTVSIEAARFTAIMGPSGSGKSTLLHVLAGLDRPTSGLVYLGDTEITSLNDRQLTLLRRNEIGFIFQSFNLLPTLTAIENIELPMRIAGRRPDPHYVASLVETVGLTDRLGHRPSELSGGQQQRVAAARALASRPQVVFADEPTGALDSRAGAELLAFLQGAVRGVGQTVVMVTHDPVAASYADRVLFLADGRIVDEMSDPTADAVFDFMKTLGG